MPPRPFSQRSPFAVCTIPEMPLSASSSRACRVRKRPWSRRCRPNSPPIQTSGPRAWMALTFPTSTPSSGPNVRSSSACSIVTWLLDAAQPDAALRIGGRIHDARRRTGLERGFRRQVAPRLESRPDAVLEPIKAGPAERHPEAARAVVCHDDQEPRVVGDLRRQLDLRQPRRRPCARGLLRHRTTRTCPVRGRRTRTSPAAIAAHRRSCPRRDRATSSRCRSRR